jgi:hypothetical protein
VIRKAQVVIHIVTLVALFSGCATRETPTQPEPTQQDVSGPWVATLPASPGCRANVPDVAWERTFDLNITQRGTLLSITRRSATFFESCAGGRRPPTDHGSVLGQTLSFVIAGDTYGDDYSFPCLFDRLSPTQWLGISGQVQGTVNGSTIRGTLDTTNGGAFDLYQSQPTATEPYGSSPKAFCHALDHSITFRRR